MEILNWTQFLVGTCLLFLGLFMFCIQILGVFKFKYVLNRMHAAAMGDTLGIGISLVGLMVLSGINFTTLKLGLVVVFLWCASPVSSHLIARLEAETDPRVEKECEISDEIYELLEEDNEAEMEER